MRTNTSPRTVVVLLQEGNTIDDVRREVAKKTALPVELVQFSNTRGETWHLVAPLLGGKELEVHLVMFWKQGSTSLFSKGVASSLLQNLAKSLRSKNVKIVGTYLTREDRDNLQKEKGQFIVVIQFEGATTHPLRYPLKADFTIQADKDQAAIPSEGLINFFTTSSSGSDSPDSDDESSETPSDSESFGTLSDKDSLNDSDGPTTIYFWRVGKVSQWISLLQPTGKFQQAELNERLSADLRALLPPRGPDSKS